MNDSIKVLHLTAHLGGGVGKALSGLVLNQSTTEAQIRHTIVCLEKPEKSLFVDRIIAGGCEVVICPDDDQLDRLISDADIVQLEWWNHPVTISCLCRGQLPPLRLLVWCHVSGLHTPIIPTGLLSTADRCLFTSPCSYEAANIVSLPCESKAHLGVVNSAGGFDGFPQPRDTTGENVRAGYIGSLNFAKLHPHYVNFLEAVNDPEFTVKMIGDTLNREILEGQCARAGRTGLLEFRGYTADVVSELATINTLVYLLNPLHYGTTENALLEAMAMGIVPIVLDNSAERHIVSDRETGLVVRNPEEFGQAIQWLQENPAKRQEIGEQAAAYVREKFAVVKMADAFADQYQKVMRSPKRTLTFSSIFGASPDEWFLACQENPTVFTEGKPIDEDFASHGFFERTKGSVFHFQQCFPHNARLNAWVKKLQLSR